MLWGVGGGGKVRLCPEIQCDCRASLSGHSQVGAVTPRLWVNESVSSDTKLTSLCFPGRNGSAGQNEHLLEARERPPVCKWKPATGSFQLILPMLFLRAQPLPPKHMNSISSSPPIDVAALAATGNCQLSIPERNKPRANTGRAPPPPLTASPAGQTTWSDNRCYYIMFRAHRIQVNAGTKNTWN